MTQLVVADSSALIIYERINRLDILQSVYDTLIVPPAVVREVFHTHALPDWIHEQRLTAMVASRIVAARLGDGEREAIALALELNASLLLLDDLPARHLAQELGIKILGSAGVLVTAKEKGVIELVGPLLREMQEYDFRVSQKVVTGILKNVGEQQT